MSVNTTTRIEKTSQAYQGIIQQQNPNNHISTVFQQFIQAELALHKAKQKKENYSIDCYLYGPSSPSFCYSKFQRAKENLAMFKSDYSTIKRTYTDAIKKLLNQLKDLSDCSFILPNEMVEPIFDCIHTFKDFKSFASTCKFLFVFSRFIPLYKVANSLAREVTTNSLSIRSYENQVNQFCALYRTTFMEMEPFVRYAFALEHREDFNAIEQIYETLEEQETELDELQGIYHGTGTYAKAQERVRIIESGLKKAEKMRNELIEYSLTPNSDKSDPSYLLKKQRLEILDNEYEKAKNSLTALFERMEFLKGEIAIRKRSQLGF